MLAKEIREKSVKDLVTLLDETSLDYFKLKMQGLILLSSNLVEISLLCSANISLHQ